MVTNNAANIATAASGSILQGQGVGIAPAWLALGAVPGTGPIYDGTGLSYFNPLQNMMFFDDFLKSPQGLAPWTSGTANGGDFNPTQPSDSGHPGVLSVTTGTNAGGQSMIYLGNINNTTQQEIILGGGAIDIYMVIQLPVLSNGTDTYEISVGLGQSQNYSNTSYDNGVFFNYSSTINSGNWQGSTSKATTKSVLNSSTAVTTSWTTLRINVNAAGTVATFYVNGSSIGTINTNLPTLGISPALNIAKSAGTTARLLYIDLVYMFQALTSAR